MKISTNNHEETLAFGKKLGQFLKPGDIVLLFGDLSAGKTTLTHGVCRGIGIKKEEHIRSPTFTLVNIYHGPIPVNHIDLYRLGSISEIEALGLEENLFSKSVSIVEWAEKLFQKNQPEHPGLGIEERIEIRICIEEVNRRTFEIELIGQNQRSLSHIL
jgi:tRNA threonylcarbamoyladenosine biosynthesis protein TsaE